MRGDDLRSILGIVAQGLLTEPGSDVVSGVVRTLVAAQAVSKGKQTVRFGVRWIIIGAVAALLFATGVGFLVSAAYMRLSIQMGSIEAASVIGVTLLVLLTIVIFAGRKWASSDENDDDDSAAEIADDVGEWIGDAVDDLRKKVASNPLPYLAGGLALGMLLSDFNARDRRKK